MPLVPDRGDTVRGGVQDHDDGSGAFVPGEAAGSDSVQGVQGGDGSRVAGEEHADTAWGGRGGETALEIHRHL